MLKVMYEMAKDEDWMIEIKEKREQKAMRMAEEAQKKEEEKPEESQKQEAQGKKKPEIEECQKHNFNYCVPCKTRKTAEKEILNKIQTSPKSPSLASRMGTEFEESLNKSDGFGFAVEW